jgi:heme exporter protein C
MPLWTPIALLLLVVALIVLHVAIPSTRSWVWKVQAVLGVAMLASGAYLGLVWAPPEREMGEVYRIIYVHVPQVWMAFLALTLNFGSSVSYLLVRKSWVADSISEASAETGVLFGAVGVALGSIWGRPTWGVWWDWDPRLTTAAIMLVIYTGYLALRKFIEDPEKRAVYSAVVGIIGFVDMPILWFSVRWWRSLHQTQSTPQTVDPQMTMSLRWSATAFLCLLFVFTWHRYLIARAARAREVALPDALPPSNQTRLPGAA